MLYTLCNMNQVCLYREINWNEYVYSCPSGSIVSFSKQIWAMPRFIKCQSTGFVCLYELWQRGNVTVNNNNDGECAYQCCPSHHQFCKYEEVWRKYIYIEGLAQDISNSGGLAMELL